MLFQPQRQESESAFLIRPLQKNSSLEGTYNKPLCGGTGANHLAVQPRLLALPLRAVLADMDMDEEGDLEIHNPGQCRRPQLRAMEKNLESEWVLPSSHAPLTASSITWLIC